VLGVLRRHLEPEPRLGPGQRLAKAADHQPEGSRGPPPVRRDRVLGRLRRGVCALRILVCRGGLVRLVSHWDVGPVRCMAPLLRAGVMIIANTISSLVNTRGRAVCGSRPRHHHGARSGAVVTKPLLLKLNPR